MGDARPDITDRTGSIRLNVSYYDSLDVRLDNSPIHSDLFENCDPESTLLFSEVDPDLTVLLNGSALSSEQYRLNGNRLLLDKEKVDIHLGANTIEVDYRVRHVTGYDDNDFTFQVGAN